MSTKQPKAKMPLAPPVPNFDAINKLDRDALIRAMGGDQLARHLWDEAVLPVVRGAEQYGMRPDSVLARSSKLRHGIARKHHVGKVVAAAENLQALLDGEMIATLTCPSTRVHVPLEDFEQWQSNSLERMRTLRHLLGEVILELDEKLSLVEPEKRLQHRLDCFIASSVWRWCDALEGGPVASPALLLDVIFSALQLGGADGFCSGANAIREARTRHLIPRPHAQSEQRQSPAA